MLKLGHYKLTYKPFGNHAILIEWPAKIDNNILFDILNFKNAILKNKTKEEIEVINTYNSLTIIYSTYQDIYAKISPLKTLYKNKNKCENLKSKLWKIPVCYDEEFGIDLDEISLNNKLSKPEIIEQHSSQRYTVFFIGFLPGFLYLGGLPEKLHFPRKDNPRLLVEKGTVGIGGAQTGIYPQQSAGGWNILGNSPINFFDCENEQPCFAKAGDEIQFVPISIDDHKKIANLVAYKRYKIESEVIDA